MDNYESLFLELSSLLTGVAVSSFDREKRQPAKAGDLEPRNSPTRLAPVYLQILQSWKRGVATERLFDKFREMKNAGNATRQLPTLLSDPVFGPLCRSIIKLWLLGTWYPPDSTQNSSHVVSVHSYVEALGWKLMQAHAPGYSMGNFGHWSEDPPTLDEFVTLVN